MRTAMSLVALILFLCCFVACIVVPGALADGTAPPQPEAARTTEAAQVAQAGGANNHVVSETRNVAVNGRTISASVVRANLADPATRVKVALGQDRVEGTEDLLNLAQRKGAIAGISGTFFNTYVKSGTKDPVGTLIAGGRMVHKGNTGTVFGITAEGEVRMDPVRFKIVGGTNGFYKRPNNWYAYFINRTPTASNSVIIYTPGRGATTGVTDGISVVVRDGQVVYIGISSKFSSGTPNARLAAGGFPDGKVTVIDSANLSTGIGLQVLLARDLAAAGKPAREIARAVAGAIPRVRTSFIIDTLDYLRMSGRCSGVQALVGTLLQIRPVISVVDGGMVVSGKVRGPRKKALDRMLHDFEADSARVATDRVFVTHTGCHEDAVYLMDGIRRAAPAVKEALETTAGAVIASHCGPNTIGILHMIR